MEKVLDVLDAYNVFYQIKFSGHRSLHLMIPAESLPRTFRDQSTNDQFDSIERAIVRFLPPTGHTGPGLRVVYSIHPRSGMVSIPLTRREIPNFRPWMANIHTISVDRAWFDVPADAVAQNERFLHIVFDNQVKNVTVSTPTFEPLSVKTYTGDAPRSVAAVRAGLKGESWQERVAAARAVLIQNIQLPQDMLRQVFRDTHNDMIWFGLEIALRDAPSVAFEEVGHLLAWKDDYIISAVDHLFSTLMQSEVRKVALASLSDAIETSSNPQAVIRGIDLLGRIVRQTAKMEDKSVIPTRDVIRTLSEVLQHRNKIVRSRAACILGRLGKDAESAVPALKQAQADGMIFVRQSATKALQRILAAIGEPPVSKPIDLSDVVLALPFNEGAGNMVKDASPYENHGVVEKEPQWTDGKFGKALRFDGASYVNIPVSCRVSSNA